MLLMLLLYLIAYFVYLCLSLSLLINVIFRYVAGKDGFKRLQIIRLEIENIFTPDVNTFMASNHMTQSDHSDHESDSSGLL